MAPSFLLKSAGLAVGTGIVMIALLYRPVPVSGGTYASVVKASTGVLILAGSLLLSSAIGRTVLTHDGRGAFKALYFASLSTAGAGVSESISAVLPVNMGVALLAISTLFATAGLSLVRFFKESGS